MLEITTHHDTWNDHDWFLLKREQTQTSSFIFYAPTLRLALFIII